MPIYHRPPGEPPRPDIHSRFYDTTGNTLDYVYELEGDILTIWGGEKGSPAYYKGTFTADGDSHSGQWVYQGGGGYRATQHQGPALSTLDTCPTAPNRGR